MVVKELLFLTFIYSVVIASSILAPSESTKTTDIGSQICAVKLSQCDLSREKGEPGEKGDKGERGERGHPGIPGQVTNKPSVKGTKGDAGLKGELGEKGVTGEKGEKGGLGLPGPMGSKGSQGIKGDQGEPGSIGLKGEKGESGRNGEKGEIGPVGPKGDRGDQGPMGISVPGRNGEKGERGHTGLPGIPGVCIKSFSEPDEDDEPEGDSETELASSVICKNLLGLLPDSTLLVMPSDPFQVTCKEDHRTCLIFNETNPAKIHSSALNYVHKEPFWLSKYKIITDLYNISMQQLLWLHSQSTFVTQTIRYHCKNSVIVPNNEEQNAMHLLTWNDIVIGPSPTHFTPFYYRLYNDGCTESHRSMEWKHTDIEMRDSINRLPIMDILIKDFRNEDQSLFIEMRELCFI